MNIRRKLIFSLRLYVDVHITGISNYVVNYAVISVASVNRALANSKCGNLCFKFTLFLFASNK